MLAVTEEMMVLLPQVQPEELLLILIAGLAEQTPRQLADFQQVLIL